MAHKKKKRHAGGIKSRATGGIDNNACLSKQEMQSLSSQLSTAEFQYNTAPNAALAVEIETIKNKLNCAERNSKASGDDNVTLLQNQLSNETGQLNTANGNLSSDNLTLQGLQSTLAGYGNDPQFIYDSQRYNYVNGIGINPNGVKLPVGVVIKDINGNHFWIDGASGAFTNGDYIDGQGFIGEWNGKGGWFGPDSDSEYQAASTYVTDTLADIKATQDSITKLQAIIGTPSDTSGTDQGIINGLNQQIANTTALLNTALKEVAVATKTTLEGQGENIKSQDQGQGDVTLSQDQGQAAIDAATGQTTSQTTLYVTIGVVVISLAAIYFFTKKQS